ncbi:MAG: cbb3-type cytochrome oxidase assembly protein CcoS [Polaromonas sp.]
MDILFLLIPLSVILALAVMGVLAWAVWSGQFEELDSEGQRILATSADDILDVPDASLIHINTPDARPEHTQASLPQKRVFP